MGTETVRHERTVRLPNPGGIHARTAARFATLARSYQSRILVTKDGHASDGKSLLSLLLLGAAGEDEVTISTLGADSREALDALVSLVQRGFSSCALQEDCPT